jgi:hypothetical protein
MNPLTCVSLCPIRRAPYSTHWRVVLSIKTYPRPHRVLKNSHSPYETICLHRSRALFPCFATYSLGPQARYRNRPRSPTSGFKCNSIRSQPRRSRRWAFGPPQSPHSSTRAPPQWLPPASRAFGLVATSRLSRRGMGHVTC